jgi:hypothetical protein
MEACLLWVLCVLRYRFLGRADHSSRGDLPSVVCPMSVIAKSLKGRSWPEIWSRVARKGKENQLMDLFVYLLNFILLMWRIGRAPNIIPIHIQQDATLHSLFISGNCSTCFGWYFHTSSGAHTTVSTASGVCDTVTAICRYRGRVGTGLSLLWVAYATHSKWQMGINSTFKGLIMCYPQWPTLRHLSGQSFPVLMSHMYRYMSLLSVLTLRHRSFTFKF